MIEQDFLLWKQDFENERRFLLWKQDYRNKKGFLFRNKIFKFETEVFKLFILACF